MAGVGRLSRRGRRALPSLEFPGAQLINTRTSFASQIARLIQKCVVALEVRDVRQHGEPARSAGLVRAGERRRIEIGADQPFGGRSVLDLRDRAHAQAGRGIRAADRRDCALRQRHGSPTAGAPLFGRRYADACRRRSWQERQPKQCSFIHHSVVPLTCARPRPLQITSPPFLGSRRLVALLRAAGCTISRKRVQRLMRRMVDLALGPRSRATKPASGHNLRGKPQW
jgi:hypothetical protein